MPLVIAPCNKALRIIKKKKKKKTKKHLDSLGIGVDKEIEIISQQKGSVICKVMEGRLALDRNIATKIIVM